MYIHYIDFSAETQAKTAALDPRWGGQSTSKWPEAGPVIPKQPLICTLLPFLPSAIIDCNSQLSSFPVFADKTGREEGASLIRATESALLRSADGHPTDRENLAQRKIDPV